MNRDGVKAGHVNPFFRLAGIFLDNPVLMKEMQIGLREKKIFIIQIVYLLVLGVVAFFYLLEVSNRRSYQAMQEAGRGFFTSLCIVQWFLVVFISPSLTSSAISSERENKTLEMLLVSLLAAPEIIIGKLAYAVSYIFLLLTTSLPLMALVFLLGGVSPGEILINYLALLLWGIMVSMMAMYFSSRESRSAVATNSVYGIVVIVGLFIASIYVPLIAESGLMLNFQTSFPEMFAWLALYFNIIWAFLFFFFKTAINIRPRASHILWLHYLFISGYIVNISVMIILAVTNSPNPHDMAWIWSAIIAVNFFLMGCFIERHRFTSSREEQILSNSITSRSFFFPAFYIGMAIIVSLILSIADPVRIRQLMLTPLTFLTVFASVIFITRELFLIFAGKLRPVLIYFSVVLSINILPLLSWLMVDVAQHGKSEGAHLLSGVFIQPIFAMYSIWVPDIGFGAIRFMASKFPLELLTIVFYVLLAVGIRLLRMVVNDARKKAIQKNVIPPPSA